VRVEFGSVSWSAAVQTVVAVFPAELPDKSMFATLALVTRFRRPLAVWIGVACGFAVHALIAASVGGLLSRLNDRLIAGIAAVMFAVGALFMWRSRHEGSEVAEVGAPLVGEGASAVRVAATSFGLLGVAELGDLTQFAIAGLAATTGEPLSVGLGGWAALVSVAGLAVLAGNWLGKRLPVGKLRVLCVLIFSTLTIWSLLEAINT
jgi:Ca2+/H+ antiporter, TMEM165/GDT1 family